MKPRKCYVNIESDKAGGIRRMKKTKIIATVGPSTDNLEILTKMIDHGMDVARFNFSHGSHTDHVARIAGVREAAMKTGRPIALMADTKGPEMRLGMFAKDKVELKAGQAFILTTKVVDGTEEKATVNYAGLPADVQPGMRILLSDGLIGLKIDRVEDDQIIKGLDMLSICFENSHNNSKGEKNA